MRKKKMQFPQKKIAGVQKIMYSKGMQTPKDSIKAWLAKYPDRDRSWLAGKCQVEKRTVDNWLSSPQRIPMKALRIIEGLMRADIENAPAAAAVEKVDLPISVTIEQYDNYCAAFKVSDQPNLRGWMVKRLDQAAAEEIGVAATLGERPAGPVAVPNQEIEKEAWLVPFHRCLYCGKLRKPNL